MTERTYGCPVCLDEGVQLEQRKHERFGYTYNAAVPCHACKYGENIRNRWADQKRNPPGVQREPNVVLNYSHGRDWNEPVERGES